MSRYLRLIRAFVSASAQPLLAYRADFLMSLFNSLLNLATGWIGLAVIFEQLETLRGWDYASALAVLGVYLMVSAAFYLFIVPGLETLSGMNGDIWTGKLDFVLLRPVNTQFFVSLRQWSFFSLFDMFTGLVVTLIAISQLAQSLGWQHLVLFLFMLVVGLLTLYSFFLAFASLAFWSPGFLITWIFQGVLQVARFPMGIYPAGVRLILTWVIPVGLVTTVPAQALTGALSPSMAVISIMFAAFAFVAASALFRTALQRYASASS